MKPSASSLLLATLAISSSSSSLAAPANDGGLADTMPSFPSSRSFNLDEMATRELRSVELADAIAARGGRAYSNLFVSCPASNACFLQIPWIVVI